MSTTRSLVAEPETVQELIGSVLDALPELVTMTREGCCEVSPSTWVAVDAGAVSELAEMVLLLVDALDTFGDRYIASTPRALVCMACGA